MVEGVCCENIQIYQSIALCCDFAHKNIIVEGIKMLKVLAGLISLNLSIKKVKLVCY